MNASSNPMIHILKYYFSLCQFQERIYRGAYRTSNVRMTGIQTNCIGNGQEFWNDCSDKWNWHRHITHLQLCGAERRCQCHGRVNCSYNLFDVFVGVRFYSIDRIFKTHCIRWQVSSSIFSAADSVPKIIIISKYCSSPIGQHNSECMWHLHNTRQATFESHQLLPMPNLFALWVTYTNIM